MSDSSLPSDLAASKSDWSGYFDVLDNDRYDVADRAKVLASKAETVRIAVGYFYFGGFDLIKRSLQKADKVEILIGTNTNQRSIDELQRGFADDLEEYDRLEAQEGINRLYKLIQEDMVDVRVYDKKRFHPKLYIFEYPTKSSDLGRAIIGSSNLSAGGLRNNVELNIEKEDDGTVRYLSEWFKDIWREASEFNKQLMSTEIEKSQFGDSLPEPEPQPPEVDTISPYSATKRFIVEQFSQDIKEGTLLQEITGDYEERLTSFQQDAFRAARRPLEKYSGVILADSVGLGKSYIGAPLVQEYTNSQDHVLIIAPKRLREMWMQDLLNTDTGEFPVAAGKTFISFSKLSRLSESEIQRLRQVDLILVDEAHNLRNTRTQRYNKLQSIGRRGKKFVMLTATPIHNSVRDVDNLMKVFADDDDFDIELGGLSPSEIFRKYDRLSSEENKSPGTQSQLSDLGELIESIMREVIISRDRKYILDNYGEITIGDREISVPDRKPRLITPDDPQLDELYDDIVDTVIGPDDSEDSGLNIPYVSADRYDADGDEEEELIIEYQNASILMLINLLKRLESSLAAFETSVERLIERERITRHIATGNLDDAKNRVEAVEQIQDAFGDDFAKDINFDDVAEAIDRVSSSKKDEIITDIDKDLRELNRINQKAQSALQVRDGHNKDAKAERLHGIIDRELSNEKVIVFSQYVPTITDLFRQLTGENPENTNIATLRADGNDLTAGFVHGGSGFNERIVEKFAPEAKEADVAQDEEVDILFTTDVLGVGQNLQDARVVVNYDLHWNPMKMEQRIGRVDRITTRHDELLIYNFAPTGDLRRQLGLVDRIQEKIEDIANTFGHAAPILNGAEKKVHKTLVTYERLDGDGIDFGDERLEGIGSKYDDLRNVIRAFCEENNIKIEELQETYNSIENDSEPQHFVTPREEGYVSLAHLEHSSGRTEWRTTIFDSNNIQSATIRGEKVFTQFPRIETDEVRVFETISSSDATRYRTSEDEFEKLQSFTNALDESNTWQNSILSRKTGESDVVGNIKQLCRQIADSNKDLSSEAEETLELLNDHEMSDWAEDQLRKIYHKRVRYGTNSTIRRLHHKLTEEIELVEPETVVDVDIALSGKLDDNTHSGDN